MCAQPHPKLQMLEQVKDAVLARAVHAPRFVDGRYLEGTFQAACSAQADELQNSCLQKLAAGALLRARHLLCTGGETAGLDRLADRPRNCTSRIRTISRRMHACGRWADRYRKCGRRRRTCRLGRRDSRRNWRMAGCTPLLRRWRRNVSCMLKMSGRESTQAEEEEVRMGFC